MRVSWPATLNSNDPIERPYFEVQRSFDWRGGEPVGERQRGPLAKPPDRLSLLINTTEPQAFYRLLGIRALAAAEPATNAAQVFGYGAAFASALAQIGQISSDEFGARFPNPTNYLSQISWQPTNALYWDQFNADTNNFNFTLT